MRHAVWFNFILNNFNYRHERLEGGAAEQSRHQDDGHDSDSSDSSTSSRYSIV